MSREAEMIGSVILPGVEATTGTRLDISSSDPDLQGRERRQHLEAFSGQAAVFSFACEVPAKCLSSSHQALRERIWSRHRFRRNPQRPSLRRKESCRDCVPTRIPLQLILCEENRRRAAVSRFPNASYAGLEGIHPILQNASITDVTLNQRVRLYSYSLLAF
jgi:hypothetical protein